jgi:NAD(P)-dependent dehydrogenase (short-subunit alcohol dehydrogenase family)
VRDQSGNETMTEPHVLLNSPASLFALHGQVALVTGGLGGLGRPIAAGLAAAGAKVAVADVMLDDAEVVLAEIAAYGQRGLALPLDVTDASSVQAVVNRLVAEFGRIDVLVNSHGLTRRMPTVDFPEADWDRIIAVNLKGVFLCCQRVGRVMIAQGRGSIINLASIGGLVGLPASVAYCASKGGVVQLTRTLGVEWAPLGVRVNAIAPSSFNTPMVQRVLATEPAYRERVVSKIPIGRIAEPTEIVGTVLYLASAASGMVTGAILPVDGGYTAQ